MEAVALAEGSNTRIIDASTAHRTNPDWAYGFPELSPAHRERIRTSQRVAVPGCYASGFISLVYPLVQAGILPADRPAALMNAMFALAGIAWATINVNSFPMVVEMSSGGDVGKYTGFYYTASMAAQVSTPMLSGLLMDRFGMHVLLPYAAVVTALAFVTMLFVRHGDSKPQAKRGLEALDEMED